MSASDHNFTGKWLHTGDRRGEDFSHELAEYDHDEHPAGATRMRHATVEQDGQQVSVWVPVEWTDEQVIAALTTDW